MKIKLDLDALQVESFATGGDGVNAGTVHGQVAHEFVPGPPKSAGPGCHSNGSCVYTCNHAQYTCYVTCDVHGHCNTFESCGGTCPMQGTCHVTCNQRECAILVTEPRPL